MFATELLQMDRTIHQLLFKRCKYVRTHAALSAGTHGTLRLLAKQAITEVHGIGGLEFIVMSTGAVVTCILPPSTAAAERGGGIVMTRTWKGRWANERRLEFESGRYVCT